MNTKKNQPKGDWATTIKRQLGNPRTLVYDSFHFANIQHRLPELAASHAHRIVYVEPILGDCLTPWQIDSEPYGAQIDRLRARLVARPDQLAEVLSWRGKILIVPNWARSHGESIRIWITRGITKADLAATDANWEVEYHKTSQAGQRAKQRQQTRQKPPEPQQAEPTKSVNAAAPNKPQQPKPSPLGKRVRKNAG